MKLFVALFIAFSISKSQAQNCTLYSGDCKKACSLYVYMDSMNFQQGSHISQRYFDSCIAWCSTFAMAYREKSVPFLKRGDFYTWKKLIDKAVEYDPRSYLAIRGWCCFKFLRDYESSLKDLQQLDTLTKGNLGYSGDGDYDLKIIIALCKRELGHQQEALADFDKCISEHENTNRVGLYDYLHRGVTNLNLKNYDKALADLIKQTKIYENLADTYYYIGVVYTQLNNLQKAKENYKIAYDKFVQGHHRKDPYCAPLDKVYLADIEEKQKQ